MKDDIRRSITVMAKEQGISGQLMKWLLWTQHRLEGTPGRFRATRKYRQYEYPIAFQYGFSYDPKFFEGVKYTKRAMKRAEKVMLRNEDHRVNEGVGTGENIFKKILAYWRN